MTSRKNVKSPRVIIDVTQEIIDVSTQRDSSHCMIADALQKAVPQARHISVDLATIRFTDRAAGLRYVYLTPRLGQVNLLAFDQGEKPEPFVLRISGAHALRTGSARKARVSLEPANNSDGTPPERRDGKSPPFGPLQGGAPKERRDRDGPGAGAGAGAGSGAGNTGRRREFGLRQIIR